MSMLLISTTRSLTSHVSYCSGISFTAGLAGRDRFEEEPWLEEEAAEEVFARVMEDEVAVGWENELGCCCEGSVEVVRLKTIWGSRAGSGGIFGEIDISRRLPKDEGG